MSISFLTIYSLILWSCVVVSLIIKAETSPQVPCLFIFGDSLSDNGNNNNLHTSAKANYKPYGVDFPGGGVSTGRFSNGRNFVDVIAELLGFNSYIPPFNNQTSNYQGLNYASGAAGILAETGQTQGDRISLHQQISNHHQTTTMRTFVHDGHNSTLLNKCLYLISMGSNDYINNYYASSYFTSHTFTPTSYATFLIDHYRLQVTRLYALGARKVAMFGLSSIGCSLGVIARFSNKDGSSTTKTTSSCVENINSATNLFNTKLISLVDELNHKFTNAKFTYINTSNLQLSPTQGFRVFNASCCKTRADGQCVPFSKPCQNRNDYIFWDLYHPTEAVSVIAGTTAYKAKDPKDAYPFDINQLVKM